MPKTPKIQITKEQYFKLLRPIASGIVETLGDHLCEVLIHDLANPESSIVCIEGDVTGREVGGPLTDLGFINLRLGDSQEDMLSYLSRSHSGRLLKSSSIMLRDETGHVFGAFCINIDISKFVALEDLIREFTTVDLQVKVQETFVDDVSDVLHGFIEDANGKIGKRVDRMSKQDKVRLVALLDEKGAFTIKKAVPLVAEYLGVSRFTIYNYLKDVRTES